jgi:hypothetical protein
MSLISAGSISLDSTFKGTVAWVGFFAHCILSRIERKDLEFFHGLLIFTELGKDLTHLAQENTQR